MKKIVRLILGSTLTYYIILELIDDFFGSLIYFTYVGNLIIGILLFLIVFKKINERHILIAFTISAIIHIVYIFLLVGISGIGSDIFSYGLSNFLLHYLTPYILLFDLIFLSKETKFYYKDILVYLQIPLYYVIYTFIYGYINHVYPYFFLDIETIGFISVILYLVAICALFVGMTSLIVKIKNRSRQQI